MLPESSVRQLQKLRQETKGKDIGDLTDNDRPNTKVPNLQYIGNPVDRDIESYEEFTKKDSKLQTIAFKSKLVNKKINENMKNDIKKFSNFGEGEEEEAAMHKFKGDRYSQSIKNSISFHDQEREDYLDNQYDDEDFVEEDDIDKIDFLSDFDEREYDALMDSEDEDDEDDEYDDDYYLDDASVVSYKEKDSDVVRFSSDAISKAHKKTNNKVDMKSIKKRDTKNPVKENIKTFEAFSVPAAQKEETPPEYTMLGKEKEPKSNTNFGYAEVRSQEIKKITDFNVIDPVTPKERQIGGSSGQFIDNDKVKGFVNRIEGKDVYVESVDDPMIIKKFNIKDVIK